MNKTDLVKKIAETADISQAAADRALFAITESITGALAKGESVSLGGRKN